MAFVKIERDECQIYFVNDDPRLASRWGCKLNPSQLGSLKLAEKNFWEWQKKLEEMIREKV